MKKDFLESGKILGPHGVRGIIKVEPWCDSPRVLAMQKHIYLAEKDGTYRCVSIKTSSISGTILLIGLEGIETREEAIALRGRTLYLKREDIPLKPGAYFLADIIGLDVIDIETGRVYGKVRDITDGVASRIYSIDTEGGEVLLPDVPEFVKEIDISRGVFIKPIAGFFD